MNLGEFHSLIQSALGRGGALDSTIPQFTRMAVRWVERNYTLQYMKQFLTVFIDVSTATTPRYVELGPGAPKAIPLFRWVLGDGRYWNLRKIDPADQDSLPTSALPQTYWLDGVERLVLGSTPTENLSGELRVDRFSAWGNEQNFTHWLLDYAEDLLMGQTLVLMAARIRDPKMLEAWTRVRDEALRTLMLADDEFVFAGADVDMEFLPSR